MYGDLAGLGLEHEALHADHIADIIGLEVLIRILADVVAANVDLDAAVQVLKVREARLTHHATGHHSAGDRHGLVLERIIVGEDFAGEMRAVVAHDFVGIAALGDQLIELFQTDAVLLGKRLLRAFVGHDFVCHFRVYSSP